MTTSVPCEGCGTSLSLPSADHPALCEDCTRKAGLPPFAPSQRPALPCARCGHAEIVRVRMRERTVVTGQQANEERVAPVAVTFDRAVTYKGFFSKEQVPMPVAETDKPFGLLDAHVCRACGFVEWYAQEPEAIPIGAVFGTALVVAKPKS